MQSKTAALAAAGSLSRQRPGSWRDQMRSSRSSQELTSSPVASSDADTTVRSWLPIQVRGPSALSPSDETNTSRFSQLTSQAKSADGASVWKYPGGSHPAKGKGARRGVPRGINPVPSNGHQATPG